MMSQVSRLLCVLYPLRMDDGGLHGVVSDMNEHQAADDEVMEML